MDNKKFVKSAATISLAAVLAALPVSAENYAIASNCAAGAGASGVKAEVYVELSCEYGGDSNSGYVDNGDVSSILYRPDLPESYGDLRRSTAQAWVNGVLVASDYWDINM